MQSQEFKPEQIKKPCQVCNGSGHVIKDGAQVTCECKQVRKRGYQTK